MKKTLLFTIVCLLILAFPVFATGEGDQAEDAEKILQVGQVGGYRSLAVYRNTLANHLFLELVYDQLLFNEKGQGYTLEAITNYTIAESKKNLTFTLRDGLTTHDGSIANADLVIGVFKERLASDEFGATPLYNQIGKSIAAINKIVDLTISIDFSDPIPHVEVLMALISISDPDMYVKADGTIARFNEQETQIGTGPFKLVEYVPSSHAYYEKFGDYWDAENMKLDGVNITFFGDNAAMVAALEAGEVDYIFRPSYDDVKRLQNNPEFKTIVPQTNQMAFILMMSPKEGITQNPLIRQAINLAINRNNIATVVTGGFNNPISTPALPGSLAYSKANEVPYEGDLVKAKELIAKSGVDAEQVIKITYPSNDAQFELICELIADNMKTVGLNPILDPIENSVYAQKRVNGEFQLLPSLIAGLNVHPAGLKDSFVFDPTSSRLEEFFNPEKVTEENRALFENYKEVFVKALITADQDVAATLFKEALGIIKEGAWVSTLSTVSNAGIASTRVKNLTWTDQDKPVFTYVDLVD
jgi:peptide/nickel transport system substrate-binding protein